jgi:AAT family amino acid transporter
VAYLRSRRGEDAAGQKAGAWFAIIALTFILIGVIATMPVWGSLVMAVVLVLITLGYLLSDRSAFA